MSSYSTSHHIAPTVKGIEGVIATTFYLCEYDALGKGLFCFRFSTITGKHTMNIVSKKTSSCKEK